MTQATQNTEQGIAYGIDKIKRFRVRDHKHRPSWKKYGSGTAEFEVRTHIEAGYLEVNLAEWSLPGGGERDVKRETMLCLAPEHARALRDWLNENLK